MGEEMKLPKVTGTKTTGMAENDAVRLASQPAESKCPTCGSAARFFFDVGTLKQDEPPSGPFYACPDPWHTPPQPGAEAPRCPECDSDTRWRRNNPPNDWEMCSNNWHDGACTNCASLEEQLRQAREDMDGAMNVLRNACDRDWQNESFNQVVSIAANAIYWRDKNISNLEEQLQKYECRGCDPSVNSYDRCCPIHGEHSAFDLRSRLEAAEKALREIAGRTITTTDDPASSLINIARAALYGPVAKGGKHG